MQIGCPPLLLLAVFALAFDSSKFWCASSLSLDDSFLSSSIQRIHKDNEQGIPGIWKLTTDALPYELDIRSKLDRRFSNDDNDDNDNESSEKILLKLNQDGTFKQCDEGYREGRWVTGRWKLQLGPKTRENTNKKATSSGSETPFSWLLLLAMNRQYFGPPYDIILEASLTSTNITNVSSNRSSSSTVIGISKRQNETKEPTSSESTLKVWQGVVRKGKFLRPSPGKHPLDMEYIGDTTNILEDAESLGTFSLEQALSMTAIDRSSTNAGEKENDEIASSSQSEVPGDNFFFPCSSSDDGGFFQ